MSNLTERELTEVWNAILNSEIDVEWWVAFTEIESMREFIITHARYGGFPLYFQQRDDWGVILSSIRWGRVDERIEREGSLKCP